MYPKLWDHVTFWDNLLCIFEISLYAEQKYYQEIISKLKMLIIWNRNSMKLLTQVSVNIELGWNRNNKCNQRSSKFSEGYLFPSIYKIRFLSREQSQSAKSETAISKNFPKSLNATVSKSKCLPVDFKFLMLTIFLVSSRKYFWWTL